MSPHLRSRLRVALIAFLALIAILTSGGLFALSRRHIAASPGGAWRLDVERQLRYLHALSHSQAAAIQRVEAALSERGGGGGQDRGGVHGRPRTGAAAGGRGRCGPSDGDGEVVIFVSWGRALGDDEIFPAPRMRGLPILLKKLVVYFWANYHQAGRLRVPTVFLHDGALSEQFTRGHANPCVRFVRQPGGRGGARGAGEEGGGGGGPRQENRADAVLQYLDAGAVSLRYLYVMDLDSICYRDPFALARGWPDATQLNLAYETGEESRREFESRFAKCGVAEEVGVLREGPLPSTALIGGRASAVHGVFRQYAETLRRVRAAKVNPAASCDMVSFILAVAPWIARAADRRTALLQPLFALPGAGELEGGGGGVACGHARAAKETTLECLEAMIASGRHDVFDFEVDEGGGGRIHCPGRSPPP